MILKTRCPDCLPYEFYVMFFFDTDMNDEVNNYIHSSTLMPKSMSEAVTILLHIL